MTTYEYLEDYVLLLLGFNPNDKSVWGWWLSERPNPSPLKLTANDEKFLSSLVDDIDLSKSFTDRQVDRVERFLRANDLNLKRHGFGLPDQFKYRNGVRIVDREELLYRDGNTLIIKSRYKEELVKQLKQMRDAFKGTVSWDPDKRYWTATITEFTLSFMSTLAEANKIRIDAEVMDMYEQLLEAEQMPYSIELDLVDGEPTIKNAPDSMIEWLDERGLVGDMITMADYAGVLNFKLSSDVKTALQAIYSKQFVRCCESNRINCPPEREEKRLPNIINWAKEVGRFPIVVYNPTKLNNHLLDQYFTADEIMVIPFGQANSEVVVPPNIKVIYTPKAITIGRKIPLLISAVNLLFGNKAKDLVDQSEKIVWNCVEITNTLTRTYVSKNPY